MCLSWIKSDHLAQFTCSSCLEVKCEKNICWWSTYATDFMPACSQCASKYTDILIRHCHNTTFNTTELKAWRLQCELVTFDACEISRSNCYIYDFASTYSTLISYKVYKTICITWQDLVSICLNCVIYITYFDSYEVFNQITGHVRNVNSLYKWPWISRISKLEVFINKSPALVIRQFSVYTKYQLA